MPARTGARVRLDYTGCLRDTVGPAGLTPEELQEAARTADRARTAFRVHVDAGTYGFDAILDDEKAVRGATAEGRRLARLADTLVVDGIGPPPSGPAAGWSSSTTSTRRASITA